MTKTSSPEVIVMRGTSIHQKLRERLTRVAQAAFGRSSGGIAVTPSCLVPIVYEDGYPIAFCILTPRHFDYILHTLCSDPRHTGGKCKLLMSAVRRMFDGADGVGRVSLNVELHNRRAVECYLSAGFVPVVSMGGGILRMVLGNTPRS